jgi:hypothetical protein
MNNRPGGRLLIKDKLKKFDIGLHPVARDQYERTAFQ